MKQLQAQQILEPADLVAEGGRSHVQLLRRLGEAQMPGGGLEGPERIQRRQGAAHDGLASLIYDERYHHL
jgi:hypothetical protein